MEVEMRKGLIRVLGISDGLLQSFDGTRRFFLSLVSQCQQTYIPLCSVAEELLHIFGPTSEIGGNPTLQQQLREVCAFISAVEEVRKRRLMKNAPASQSE